MRLYSFSTFSNIFVYRLNEQERVMKTFNNELNLPVTCVDASAQFFTALKGVTDPEKKKIIIIGIEFTTIFDKFAHGLEKELGRRPTYLVQGTLYPDVIESCPPPGSGKTHSHKIKSHRNVGGLPKGMKLKLIEPLKLLFKDEVDFYIFKYCFFSSLYIFSVS